MVLAGGRGDVELVGDVQLALARPRPAYGELAESGDLFEGDGALTEQLQQRQEPRNGGHAVRRVTGQGTEGERCGPPQPVDDQPGLLAHADGGRVQVSEREHLRL